MGKNDTTKTEVGAGPASEEPTFRVDDRRHWQLDDAAEATGGEPARPTVLDEYRRRAEAAEQKLLEYVEAFKLHKDEQQQVRERLERDVVRKVELRFGSLVGDLLEMLDDLERSLEHVRGVATAEPLARGVSIARDRFLATLQRHGVERFTLDGAPFDPNEAEAMRVDPVDSPGADQCVTQTLQAGYRLGDRVLRAAKVAVGRYGSSEN